MLYKISYSYSTVFGDSFDAKVNILASDKDSAKDTLLKKLSTNSIITNVKIKRVVKNNSDLDYARACANNYRMLRDKRVVYSNSKKRFIVVFGKKG